MFKKIVCFCTSLALSSISLFSCPVNIVADTSQNKTYTLNDLHSDNLIFNETYDLSKLDVSHVEWFDSVFSDLHDKAKSLNFLTDPNYNHLNVDVWTYSECPWFWVYSEIVTDTDNNKYNVDVDFVKKFCAYSYSSFIGEDTTGKHDFCNVTDSNNITDYIINYSNGEVSYTLKEDKSENTKRIELVNNTLDSSGFNKYVIKTENVSVDGCKALRVYYAYKLYSSCMLRTVGGIVRICKSDGDFNSAQKALFDNITTRYGSYSTFVLDNNGYEQKCFNNTVTDLIWSEPDITCSVEYKMVSNTAMYKGNMSYNPLDYLPFTVETNLDKDVFYGDINSLTNYVYQDTVYVKEPYDLSDGTVVFCNTPYTISFLWAGAVNITAGTPEGYDYNFTNCKVHHANQIKVQSGTYNTSYSVICSSTYNYDFWSNPKYMSNKSLPSASNKMTDIFKYDVENDKLCKYNGNNLEYLADDELHYNVPITIGDVSVEYHVDLKHPQQGRTVVYKVGEQQPEKVYTEDDLNLGDIDSNGKIEIQDCQFLLMYYTENLTGNDVGTLKDFVNKNN